MFNSVKVCLIEKEYKHINRKIKEKWYWDSEKNIFFLYSPLKSVLLKVSKNGLCCQKYERNIHQIKNHDDKAQNDCNLKTHKSFWGVKSKFSKNSKLIQ